MSQSKRSKKLLRYIFFFVYSCLLISCGVSTQSIPQVISKQCQVSLPAPIITNPTPETTQETVYATSRNHLYALDASNGTIQWCQQVFLTRMSSCPPQASCPGGPVGILFGTPTVVNGTAYVCASGEVNKLYAFNANNGALLWQTSTDCELPNPALSHHAPPLVDNGIVYDGTYALRASNGGVLWRIPINTQTNGGLEIQALEGDTIYANTQSVVYAINASNGKIRWHYQVAMPIGGPLAVANQKLYVGTLGSADNPQASRLYALSADTGSLLWQYQIGDYQGAAVSHETLYVISRDHSLYAFQESSSRVLWKHSFAFPVYQMALSAENVLAISIDGVYALRDGDGTVLWHNNFQSDAITIFTPPAVNNGIIYLAATNTVPPQSTLYALNLSNGSIYWQRVYPFQINSFTLA